MGMHLSIDDFGTGYSSLSALQQFPISTLKIDQSFVRNAATDPDDATIVRTIIEMGRSLDLQVLAEGIETEEQRDFLLLSGCQFGQGRLFGEPVSAEDFLERVLRQATGEYPVLHLPA
jgi:EAL domain-containing protein (putative c-di-GMP-specific phosphodiesterase class I)